MNLPVVGIPSFGTPAFGIPVFGTPDFVIPGFGKSQSRGEISVSGRVPVWVLPAFGIPTFGILAFGIPVFGIPTVGSPAFRIPTFESLVEFRYPLIRHPLDYCAQGAEGIFGEIFLVKNLEHNSGSQFMVHSGLSLSALLGLARF